MVSPKSFFEALTENNIEFFAGVPDSLLKDFCGFVNDNVSEDKHIIAANEGNAVALAMGYYLASKKIGLVYLQNSGLGNTLNPLVSLADPEIYSVPILLLVGWRGEEGVPDEPQHKKQGKITLSMLEVMGVPYKILPDNDDEAKVAVQEAYKIMMENSAPYALVVKSGTFSNYEGSKKNISSDITLSREDALKSVIELISRDAVVVGTTGKLSRELFELRVKNSDTHDRDFLTVGGMGHASSIALGIAIAKPTKKVYCFDGDGASIMHLGAYGTAGKVAPKNFIHIVFNNKVHDSVGGQPTAASVMDFGSIAKASNYKHIFCSKTEDDIKINFKEIEKLEGPILMEILVTPGARKDLGRPTRTPLENKNDFMNFLNN
ncbi:MAG: phosphonopyruvate decarboxylase [Patescibacteria group bacterium]